MGVNHRRKRHYFNVEDQRIIKDHWRKTMGEPWGERALVEWLFHIALDNLETAYKFSLNEGGYGANTYNYLRVILNPNGYIDCKFDRIPGTLILPR